MTSSLITLTEMTDEIYERYQLKGSTKKNNAPQEATPKEIKQRLKGQIRRELKNCKPKQKGKHHKQGKKPLYYSRKDFENLLESPKFKNYLIEHYELSKEATQKILDFNQYSKNEIDEFLMKNFSITYDKENNTYSFIKFQGGSFCDDVPESIFLLKKIEYILDYILETKFHSQFNNEQLKIDISKQRMYEEYLFNVIDFEITKSKTQNPFKEESITVDEFLEKNLKKEVEPIIKTQEEVEEETPKIAAQFNPQKLNVKQHVPEGFNSLLEKMKNYEAYIQQISPLEEKNTDLESSSKKSTRPLRFNNTRKINL